MKTCTFSALDWTFSFSV